MPGLLIFNLVIGGLVAAIGYTPFFIGLAVLDLGRRGGPVDRGARDRNPARPRISLNAVHTAMTPKSIIRNPILRGFNPDPSIVRVGDDYYIATSTFEWFPGVQIHHSRDLVHWRLLDAPAVSRQPAQHAGRS